MRKLEAIRKQGLYVVLVKETEGNWTNWIVEW